MNNKSTFFAGAQRVCGAVGIALVLLTGAVSCAKAQDAPLVRLQRVPDGGLQPEVVVRGDVVHLLYFKGEAAAGDLFYTRSVDGGATWKPAIRVNSREKSAIAMGTIRGGRMAVGRGGRVFVEWNGSDAAPRSAAAPDAARKYGAAPLEFARLNEAGDGFEPERNMLSKTWNLDGGAGIAADEEGRVYVAWHGHDKVGENETGRRVFLAVSRDDGKTFSPEAPVWNEPTGACGCCSVGIMARNGGEVALLYRSATEMVHRDTYFLSSNDAGRSFAGQKLATWNIAMCPMSSFSFAAKGGQNLAAWENQKQVYFSPLDADGKALEVQSASGEGDNRKYPGLVVNDRGLTLFLWTQNTSWGRGGDAAWQLFDPAMRPMTNKRGDQKGVPAWSFAAAFARRDGGFTVLY